MTDAQHTRAVAARRHYIARWALGVVTVLALLGFGAAMLHLSLQTKANSDRTRATSALIQSCVDPDGECFRRGAERQAQVIGDPPAPINDVVILAAACADRPGVDTEAEIRECVLEGLSR